MKSLLRLSILIAFLILLSLACNLPQQASTVSTPTHTPTSTLALTATLPATQALTELPPTLIPPTPTPEAVLSPYQPSGYYVVPPSGDVILIYDRNHQLLAQFSAPGLYGDNPDFTHMSGHLNNGVPGLSVTYFSWSSFSLMHTDQNGVTVLRNVPEFFMMAGVPGTSFIAFTQLEYAESALRSLLIAGDITSIATAPAIMTVVDTASYAIRPLAIAHDQGSPRGVYYTAVPYGIGGDIIFEPRRALSYLDLASYQSQDLLDNGTRPSGFSPDLTWLAYTQGQAGAIMIAPVADLGRVLTLPLLPESDRGAGDAVFSPDNQFVAWKEGSGWMMSETPNFHATIRIATTSGTVTAQIPDTAIAALIGNPSMVWVQPVGWLDSGTLLLEARGDEWANATLLQVNPDGSGLSLVASGGFMGFIYP